MAIINYIVSYNHRWIATTSHHKGLVESRPQHA
jgi:hypothetical protein